VPEYTGYFKDEGNGQWMYHVDVGTGQATLRGGDAGWRNVYPVSKDGTVAFILKDTARAWLEACWIASADHRRNAQHSDA
jgi:hypothetical protein